MDKERRDDDCEYIINAIKMIKGVRDVQPLLADPVSYMEQEKARRDQGQKLLEIVYPKV